MKKIVYDFKQAAKQADEWYKPSELSAALKLKALRCAALDDNGTDVISELQCAVLDACYFLDAIKEMEVEQ